MARISTVTIKGIWGFRQAVIHAKPHVNILIGENGTGKTTIIQIIAALLQGDLRTLASLPFDEARLDFVEDGTRRLPSITYKKEIGGESPYPLIVVDVREKASASPRRFKYLWNEEESDFYYQALPSEGHGWIRRGTRHAALAQHDLKHIIAEIVQSRWLSIHRAPGVRQRDESQYQRRSLRERSFESSVDQKLDVLSNELARYLSSLDSQAAEYTSHFQQTVFLSLLHVPSEQQLLAFVKGVDIGAERSALESIFKRFNLIARKHRQRLNQHFRQLSDAVSEAKASLERGNLDWTNIGTLFSTLRIESVVKDWNELSSTLSSLYEPKNDYLEMLNRLISTKDIEINPRNEVVASVEHNRSLSLHELSSGEKQLVILLTEVLLQRRQPWVFIADEPELSLHVTWQEQLLHNLLALNPTAQIFVATHSPDIIGEYRDAVFEMQNILS